MNIVSNYPQVPLSPVNPATQTVRQENLVKDVIKQPTQTEQFPREPGIAKEHEAQRNQTKEPRQRYTGTETSQTYSETRLSSEGEPLEAISDEEGRQNQDDGGQNASSQDNSSESNGDEDSARQQEQEEQQEAVEKQEISELQSQDREVRAHEQAHSAVGGQYAGAPKFDYETGPDSRQYAVSGEVRIDISPVPGDPKATIQKMRQVRAAALAPADPSAQDLKVAAEANRMIAEAQGQLLAGEEGESRYPGGSRTLGGLEGTPGGNESKGDEEEGFYTEAVMAHRNLVISEAYRVSSKPTISAMQLSA